MDDLTRLLLEARDGEPDSLVAFVRITQPSIWRLCAHLVGKADADDATQETYLAAWRSVGSFRADSSARTWLFVIARRSASRVAERRRRWDQLSEHAPPPGPRAHPEATTELNDLLSRLAPDKRIAFLLTQVFGLTYLEAADVCDCPVGTIRSRVARAREDLVLGASRAELPTGTSLASGTAP